MSQPKVLCEVAKLKYFGKGIITLPVSNWNNNTQVVDIDIVNENCTVFVSPEPDSQDKYSKSEIKCVSQSSGKLTFTCNKLPDSDITVNLVTL